jgi:cell division protein FtsQ
MGKKQTTKTTREKQCKKISKQRATRQRVRSFARITGAVFSLAFLGVAGIAGWSIYENGKLVRWQQQAVDSFWQTTADAGFVLNNVYLHGHHKIKPQEVLKATSLAKGNPLLAYSLSDLQEKLEAVPLIRKAHIIRRLPNTLNIRIEERAPAALWQHQGKLHLVDADGVVMERLNQAPAKTSLPLLVGKIEPHHIKQFFAYFARTPRILNEMHSATLVSQRRWNILLKQGMEIKLPEQQLELALDQLEKLHHHKMLDNLLQRPDIQLIDLRMPDRMFIRQAKPEPEEILNNVSEAGAQNT